MAPLDLSTGAPKERVAALASSWQHDRRQMSTGRKLRTARHYRALGTPRSHQSGAGCSRIIAAAISTGKELQNFHSSFAARE